MTTLREPTRPIIRPNGFKSGLTPAPESLRTLSGIPVELRAVLFDVVSGGPEGWPLLLTGPAGVGKTCAALVMYDRYGGWYADLPSFHERLLEIKGGTVYWDGPTGCLMTVRDFAETWGGVSLAVMDEIGQRAPSDAQYETLKAAIDRREGKPAIYISNMSLNGLAKVYDDRIVSRVASGTVFEFSGSDRRISKRG